MASFDWKAAVRDVAPAVAGVLGGPAAGLGVKVLADVLLGGSTGDAKADEAKISEALAGGLTPELRAKLIEAESNLKLELRRLALEERKVDAEVERAYIADATSAREQHKASQSVIRAAFVLNAIAYTVVCGVLAGCFAVLLGHGTEAMRNVDPGIAAMVGSIIGASVQFVVGNAGQAAGFLFGSSPSARANAQRMAEAVELAARKGVAK